MFHLLTFSVSCYHVRSGTEFAEIVFCGCLSVLEETSSSHYCFSLDRHFLEFSLCKIAGTTVVEGIIELCFFVIFFPVGMSFVFHGVVVPSFDDDLCEENEGNWIKRYCIALLSF